MTFGGLGTHTDKLSVWQNEVRSWLSLDSTDSCESQQLKNLLMTKGRYNRVPPLAVPPPQQQEPWARPVGGRSLGVAGQRSAPCALSVLTACLCVPAVCWQMTRTRNWPWRQWRSWSGVWTSWRPSRPTALSATWPPPRYERLHLSLFAVIVFHHNGGSFVPSHLYFEQINPSPCVASVYTKKGLRFLGELSNLISKGICRKH